MRKIWKSVKRLLFLLWLTNLVYTISLRWIRPIITPNMIVSIVRNINTDKPFRHTNISYDSMGQHIKWAVVASEDQRFGAHHGFDFDQIKSAIENKDKKSRGASTITQQTAKNLFYINKRSWIRKGLEMYSTLLLEIFLPKDKILEHYLNIAELGPNIYGIEAASQHYFHKTSKDLTANEASFLAAILPSPIKRGTTQKNLAQKKAQWIQKQIPYLKKDESLQKIIGGG